MAGKKLSKDELIKIVNEKGTTWTAKGYDASVQTQGSGITSESLVKKFTAKTKGAAPKIDADLPKTFDARTKWPKCTRKPLSQGSCNSCWAFAATSVLADRMCIQGDQKSSQDLSVQYILECHHALKCKMGNLSALGFSMLKNKGTTSFKCNPYKEKGQVDKCQKNKCQAEGETDASLYKFKKVFKVGSLLNPTKHISALMREVQKGPVVATYACFDDFHHYKSGVYQYVAGGLSALHTVKIIGWGTEKGVDYWLCENSWGSWWGDGGYFKIRRGVNECGIEMDFYSGDTK
jgi:cathepsin B